MPSLLNLSNDCLLIVIDFLKPKRGRKRKESLRLIRTDYNLRAFSETCRRFAELTANARLHVRAVYTELQVHPIWNEANKPTVLAQAARDGDFGVVEKLICRPGFTAAKRPLDDPKACAFAAAVIEGNREMFDFLLSRDRRPDAALERFLVLGNRLNTALDLAAGTGNIDMFEYILSLYPPGILRKLNFPPPVGAAVRSGNIELLRRILAFGFPRPGPFPYNKLDPFYYLEEKHSSSAEDMVKALLDAGYELNIIPDIPGHKIMKSPLLHHCAPDYANIDIIKTLVVNGADVNWGYFRPARRAVVNRQDPNPLYRIYRDYQSPFICAARKGDYKLMQFLIDHGATPYHSRYKYFPCFAAHEGDIKLYRYLVDVLHLPLPPNNPKRPLQEPCYDPTAEELKEFELAKPALSVAAERGNVEMVRMLIQDGHDVNASDGLGMTPMHRATRECAKILLSHGANHTARDDQVGWTPFAFGVFDLDPYKLQVLLEHDAEAFREEISISPRILMDGLMHANPHEPRFYKKEKHRERLLTLIELLAIHGADLQIAGVAEDITMVHMGVHFELEDIVNYLRGVGQDPNGRLSDTYGRTTRDYAAVYTKRMRALLYGLKHFVG